MLQGTERREHADEPRRPRTTRRLLVPLFLAASLTASSAVSGQTEAVSDDVPVCGDGRALTPYAASLRLGPPYIESSGPAATRRHGAGGAAGVTFFVEYLDVTNGSGVGFDDPVLGATRRGTLMAVLNYVESVLPYSGFSFIEVQESETDGSGFLGTAQPVFDPAATSCTVIYPITHLTTGIDPDPVRPDGIVLMDFGYAWNSDLGPPTSVEYDLFTVLLHELTHALGFFSMSSHGSATRPGATSLTCQERRTKQ